MTQICFTATKTHEKETAETTAEKLTSAAASGTARGTQNTGWDADETGLQEGALWSR